MSSYCEGSHKYFVADVASVEAEGKVVIIAMCTLCGDTRTSTHYVLANNQKKD